VCCVCACVPAYRYCSPYVAGQGKAARLVGVSEYPCIRVSVQPSPNVRSKMGKLVSGMLQSHRVGRPGNAVARLRLGAIGPERRRDGRRYGSRSRPADGVTQRHWVTQRGLHHTRIEGRGGGQASKQSKARSEAMGGDRVTGFEQSRHVTRRGGAGGGKPDPHGWTMGGTSHAGEASEGAHWVGKQAGRPGREQADWGGEDDVGRRACLLACGVWSLARVCGVLSLKGRI